MAQKAMNGRHLATQITIMEAKRLQDCAGKQACDNNQLQLNSGFDDDTDWSDEQPRNDSTSAASVKAAGTEEPQENRSTSESQASDMDAVSPLIRSIFENRKKLILDANQRTGGGTAPFHSKHVPQRGPNSEEYEKMLNKKVQALDEEVAIFKKESKRQKSLSKEHAEGLRKLAREKAEWEEQKKSQMQAFQAQQEEQIEKLKKEKQVLDHRSAALNGLPAAQRKDVEELKESMAKQQEEHRGKELRLRLTINRLRAMNEDLTRQVLEMQEEIRRYETCLLSTLDSRENGSKLTLGGDSANPTHSCSTTPRKESHADSSVRGRGSLKASKQCSMAVESPCETPITSQSTVPDAREQQSRNDSISTPRHLSEQAKSLSDLFSRPWMAADCAAKLKEENSLMSRHLMGPKLADWR